MTASNIRYLRSKRRNSNLTNLYNRLAQKSTNSEYEDIIFFQNAEEDLKDRLEHDEDSVFDIDQEEVLEYIIHNWWYPGEHMILDKAPWGSSDYNFEKIIDGEKFIMSYNPRLGYIGVVREISSDKEQGQEPEPEEEDIFFGDERGKTVVSYAGKVLDIFDDEEDARKFIKEWMNTSNYWPNVWFVSDHGDFNLIKNL